MRCLLSVLLLFFLLACHPPERASGPLRQEAYVWQRSWTPAVQESVRQATDFARLVVLVAEVDLRESPPSLVRIPLDGEALRAAGRPVGAALRITTFAGRFADDSGLAQRLQRLVRDVVGEARGKGLSLAEIQIDYDCPASKLADYRDLLPALREAAAPVPLTITTLPTWLRQRRAFRQLIEAADGYVLQLHSLVLPEKKGERITLIEPRSAKAWVEEAALFRAPFRAALPSYGYEAAFDKQGKLLGLLAEGPLLSWSGDVTVLTVRSDPAAMAALIRDWSRNRPAELAGVLWYRLPVAGERLNWTVPTLRAVITGRPPQGRLRAITRQPEPGLVEIDLVNAGEADAAWPAAVRLRWRGAAPNAADGLSVYQVGAVEGSEIRLQRSGAGLLRPGERRTIAWLRFAVPTEVEVELP